MQKLGLPNIRKIRSQKIKNLEKELKEEIYSRAAGELFLCPFCKYESRKNKRGTAKVFKSEDGTSSFKCFSCGRWRKL